MKIIRPTPITDATLTSSTIAETDFAAWVSGTTYAAEAKAVRLHRIYQSVTAGNVGHAPESSPTFWTDIGPTNRWAMFDDRVGTVSIGTGSIVTALTPGSIDAIGIVDTDAETVRLVMTNAGTTVYDRSQSTNAGGNAIDDWFLYFFEPIGRRTALTFMDVPVYVNGSVAITFTGANPAGPVTVGTLILGRQMDLGTTEAGADVGILDFSRKETDAFGTVGVVERAWAKRMQVRTLIETSAAGAVQRELAKVRATPVLWIGEEGYDPLTVYGFYKEFSIDLALANISYCSLTVEGLT